MEETRPIDQQEEEWLDAVARVLILRAKQIVESELNDKNEQESKQIL